MFAFQQRFDPSEARGDALGVNQLSGSPRTHVPRPAVIRGTLR